MLEKIRYIFGSNAHKSINAFTCKYTVLLFSAFLFFYPERIVFVSIFEYTFFVVFFVILNFCEKRKCFLILNCSKRSTLSLRLYTMKYSASALVRIAVPPPLAI